jgi:predicted DsbA family dithiol-disulfide isomerase
MTKSGEPRLKIDVWSDVMCPFCYMGDALLAKAIEQFPHAEHVDVRYRSYQLMPGLPVDSDVNATEILVRAKGIPRAQAVAMNAQVEARAAKLGLEYHLDKALVVNTRAAQRLSHFARREGKQHELMIRLFRAYFTEGKHLGKYEVLAGLAADVGLDRARALEVLETGAFEDEVAADQRRGRDIGISGVPFFVFDDKHAVSGAQPVGTFLEALDTAWNAKAR